MNNIYSDKLHLYRATIWVLTSMVAAVEGYAGLSRKIVQFRAHSPGHFKAIVMDNYLYDVDAEIHFGPITDKGEK